MWFIFALLTTLSWAFADLFYKKGAKEEDKSSHIKTVIMVGLVMGIHGFGYMLMNNIQFSVFDIVRYFPVSFLYILSMTLGYVGLRYIELSISSPVQNSSGAVTAILIYLVFTHHLSWLEIFGIAIITFGVVVLAVLEKKRDKIIVLKDNPVRKYQISVMAILFPILYCIIDGLGTFADAVYLDELQLIGEEEALLAYEFTFFLCAVIAFIYLTVRKKEKFRLFQEKEKAAAAVFETIGQFFYVFAMAKNAIIAAPLIASYSMFSVLLSRIFLKEKLSKKQYAVVIIVMIGIALLGLSEEL